jgi:anti-sigma factor RsiW
MFTPANQEPDANDDLGDATLRLYAQGKLSGPLRRRVEGLLACNPDLAAQVMSQMHMLGPSGGNGRRALSVRTASVAVLTCIASGLLGWFAAVDRNVGGWREADGESPPGYVLDAADSRQATKVRAEMASQVETPTFDASELRNALKLRLPSFPPDWRILDVQVYPSDVGPSVNLVFETADRQRLELFAVRANTPANDRPEIARRGHEAVAFWERGEIAYVLSGEGSTQKLLGDAAMLSKRTTL